MLFLQFKNNMLWLFSLLKVHHMFSNQCFPLQISWKKKGKSDREVKKIKKGFMTKNLFHKHCCMLQMKSYISMITIIWWPADVYQLSQGF